jgi:hypothetical protein
MTDSIVRPMTAEDRAGVIELLAFSDPWKRLGYQANDWDSYFAPLPQGRDSYVVDQIGRVAGIAVVRQKFLLGDYVELLGVADWARGKGLGGAVARSRRSGGLREGEESVRLRIGFQRSGPTLLQETGLPGDRSHAEFSDPWQRRNPAS